MKASILAILAVVLFLAGCAGGAHDPAFVCDDPSNPGECRYSGEVGSGEGFGEGAAEGEGEAEGGEAEGE